MDCQLCGHNVDNHGNEGCFVQFCACARTHRHTDHPTYAELAAQHIQDTEELTALEAQVKALKEDRDAQAEAVRVLGLELFNRCFLGYDREWAEAVITKIANPIAAAAVKGGTHGT